MASGRESATELTERILAEIKLTAPAALERSNSREQLRKRINKLLAEEGYPAEAPERRSVTVAQVQVHGFGEFAERHSAVAVVGVLNRYLAQMTEIIGSYGGTFDCLHDAGLLVLFGAPVAADNPVEKALACAVEMQQAMTRFNQQNNALQISPWFIGIGIHSGDVVAGPVGASLHREYSVLGNTVSLAGRIAAQALRGQVLLSEDCYRQAREHVLVGEPGRLQLKGRRALALYELLGTTRPRAMTVPRRETRKSPRVPVQMPCYFQRMDGRTALPTLHCGQVEDLGYHGLRLLSPVPLQATGEIKMALSLQLFGEQTSPLYARVLSEQSEVPGYRCSMEFIDVDIPGQQALKQFVDSQVSRV